MAVILPGSRQTDRWTDTQTDRQTGRQTDTHQVLSGQKEDPLRGAEGRPSGRGRGKYRRGGRKEGLGDRKLQERPQEPYKFDVYLSWRRVECVASLLTLAPGCFVNLILFSLAISVIAR